MIGWSIVAALAVYWVAQRPSRKPQKDELMQCLPSQITPSNRRSAGMHGNGCYH